MKTKTLLGVPALAPLFAAGLLFIAPSARPGGEIRRENGEPILFPDGAPQIAPDETENTAPVVSLVTSAPAFDSWHRAQPSIETATSQAHAANLRARELRELWEARKRGELGRAALEAANEKLVWHDQHEIEPVKPAKFYKLGSEWFPIDIEEFTGPELAHLRERVNRVVDEVRDERREIEDALCEIETDIARRSGNIELLRERESELEERHSWLQIDEDSAFGLLCEIAEFERDWNADLAAFAHA